MTGRRRLASLFRGVAAWLDPEPPAELHREVVEELRPPAPSARRALATLSGLPVLDLNKMPPRATPFARKRKSKPEA